jgi:hypothetical protein
MNRRAVALISGGLDSALAIHLVKSQGIDLTAVHFTSFFSSGDPSRDDSTVTSVARQLAVPVVFTQRGDDFLSVIRKPRYGHGKNLNPCIDCRIYTFIKAKELMQQLGASFLVTGEVVGQRPMSQQRNTLRLIEKQAGCDNIVLRPLSAKILPPTLPEQAGVVDREKLLDVAGRGRKVQLKLAEEIGLSGYSAPAGGCLLTDRGYSGRLRDLLADKEDVSAGDLQALAIGRHVRVRPGLKLVIGRRDAENQLLWDAAAEGVLFFPIGFPGPVVLAMGRPTPEEELLIGGVILRYAKESVRGKWIGVKAPGAPERRVEVAGATPDEWISDHMI